MLLQFDRWPLERDDGTQREPMSRHPLAHWAPSRGGRTSMASSEGALTVLGIDAAWTNTAPSGVALLRPSAGGWECVAVAPSYHSFATLALGADVEWFARHSASAAEPSALLRAAAAFTDLSVVVVAVD